jgi:predicted transcriptional regulator
MTKTSKILAFVQERGQAAASEVAAALGIEAKQASSILLQMMRRGVVNRSISRMSASNTPVYMYTCSKDPVVSSLAPVVSVDTPQVHDEVAVAVPKPKRNKAAGLDVLVDHIAAMVAKQLANKIKTRLVRELENMMPVEDDVAVDLTPLMDKLAAHPPKAEAATRKPVVGVAGLLPVQAGELSVEFGECMDLRFWDSDQPLDKLKALAKGCDVVFLHTRHAKHSHDQYLVVNGANIQRVTGGLSNMRDAMTKYFVEV